MWSRIKNRAQTCIVFWGLASSSFLLWNFDRAPHTKRWRIQGFSRESEVILSKRIQPEILQECTSRKGLEYTKTVNRLVYFLSMAAEGLYFPHEDPHVFPWTVHVVDSDEVNAHCGPGGNIIVNTGLIEYCMDAQALGHIDSALNALSCLLAHEIAHGIAQHSCEKLTWMPFFLVGQISLEVLMLVLNQLGLHYGGEKEKSIRDCLQQATRFISGLPHSKTLEAEADMIACEILCFARFPLADFPKILLLFNSQENETHPGSAWRSAQLQVQVDKQRKTNQCDC